MKTVKWWNKKWRSYVNSKDFNPKERWNVTLCGKLRWIPPQTVSAATFVPAKVMKKMSQTPSNCRIHIQSWMCWFQEQYKKHLLQCSFKVKFWRNSNYSRWSCLCEELKAINSLLPIHEGRDCYMRQIVENFHVEKTECHNQQAMQRSRDDKRKL